MRTLLVRTVRVMGTGGSECMPTGGAARLLLVHRSLKAFAASLFQAATGEGC